MDGKEIKEIRLALGINRSQFGDLVLVDPSTVQRWEAGLTLPTPKQQQLIRKLDIARKKNCNIKFVIIEGFNVGGGPYALWKILEIALKS